MIWKLVLLAVCSYFIGNINFARIISKYSLKDDITKHGSGNPGTTNMYRRFGLKIGLLTLALDVLKGVIPTLLGLLCLGSEGAYMAGAFAVIGHIFPVIYKFKGGKGVATTLGVFWVTCPLWMTIIFVIMFVLIYLFEYMSPVSLLAISSLVCIEAVRNEGSILIISMLFIIFALTWWAHRANIVRLFIGKENKTSLKGSIKKLKEKRAEENTGESAAEEASSAQPVDNNLNIEQSENENGQKLSNVIEVNSSNDEDE